MDPFLSVLSHEMRNPLAALGTCIESLRLRQRGNVVVQESAQLLQRQLRQLTRLVDDVLDVTRLQTGKLAIKRSAVDLRELLRQVMDGRKPLSEGERRAFNIDLPSQPVVVVADSARLLQVFNNLLDNAVKCTREGGRIEMALAVQDAEAVVSISDDGIGLSPAGRERVFQWYVQEHPGRQGGLGIGLALVRQLVALQDGRVEVSSPGEGQGCRFSVCLPLPQELPPWGETRAQVEAGRH